MRAVIGAYGLVLGPLAGFLLAKFIPDETQWYPKQFLLAASLLFLVACFLAVSWPLALILAGAGLFSLATQRAWLLVAVSLAVALLASSLVAVQVLAVALIPVAGYFVHYKQDKQLLWFLAAPIVITIALLL